MQRGTQKVLAPGIIDVDLQKKRGNTIAKRRKSWERS